MEKLRMMSRDVVGGNVQKIAALFPQCVTERLDKEGKPELAIDFDKLRAELSNEVLDEGEERYQFTWPDKRAASRLANTPTTQTLRPCREESVDFDSTQNLYIEGDNLDVLKVLRETYLGKVKMIYIDPPYNTGNDFVYNDDFAQGKGDFEAQSGLFDDEGNQTVDPMQRNTESNGRFHTDWLNMIYPRLKVAKDLLSEDGVIFISIDDNEQKNLKNICDEVFGENNFIADLIWANKEGGGSSDSRLFRIKHEHILCFAKRIENIDIKGVPISNQDRYKGKDEHFAIRGPYYLQKLGMGSIQYSESLDYEIICPDGTMVKPSDNNGGKKACWRWSKEKYIKNSAIGFVEIKKDSNNIWTVYTKQYMNCDNDGNIIKRTQRPMGIIEEYSSTQAAKLLRNMSIPFDYSKPIELISYLIDRCCLNDSIILDFFSGSATTAHAVMQLNSEDGGNRKFIMVQLPEATDEKSEAYKAGYKNICEIGKERIRRAGRKILESVGAQNFAPAKANANNTGKMGDKSLFDDNETIPSGDIPSTSRAQNIAPLQSTQLTHSSQSIQLPDVGFRVLKLDSSNMEDVYYTPDSFTDGTLENLIDNIKHDRTSEDLLFQVMLDLGIELSAKIEKTEIAGKEVWCVDGGYLMACFDRDVNEATITEIAKQKPVYFVMRDASAANDNVLDNFDQLFANYSPDTTCKIL